MITKILKKIENNKNIYVSIFFFGLLIIGLTVYKDYSIPGDEAYHRWSASLYFNFIKDLLFNFNFKNESYLTILNYLEDKHLRLWFMYPMFFDILNEFIVNLFNLKKLNIIFELRHLTNFIFFWISLIFIYKLINNRFKKKNLALLTVIVIFFSPRIFAESFYNSKDLLFLSLLNINLYFTYKFFEQRNIKNLILFSIVSGLLINTRIMGLIFLVITYSFILFESIDNKKKFYSNIYSVFISLLISFFVVFVFWPYLWFDPLDNLTKYFTFLEAGANIIVTNLYFGEIIDSNNTPWHYLPVWVGITLPISFIFFFLFGLFFILKQFIKSIFNLEKLNYLWKNSEDRFDFFIILSILIILLASFLYQHNWDGWRHYYFLYPLLVYCLVFFLNLLKNFNLKFYKISLIAILINYSFNIFWIFNNHPYQYVYFNSIKKYLINKNFDLDWWALSVKNSFEHILDKDNRNKIKISSIGEFDIKASLSILNKVDRDRFETENLNDANYVIKIFRPKTGFNEPINLDNFEIFYELKVDNNLVNVVYKSTD